MYSPDISLPEITGAPPEQKPSVTLNFAAQAGPGGGLRPRAPTARHRSRNPLISTVTTVQGGGGGGGGGVESGLLARKCALPHLHKPMEHTLNLPNHEARARFDAPFFSAAPRRPNAPPHTHREARHFYFTFG